MSATARKTNFNAVSTSRQKIAAIQIEWKKMRPNSDNEESRAERLSWITTVLNLRKQCESLKDLSEKQLGIVLDEIRRTTNQKPTTNSHATRFNAKPRLQIVQTHPSTQTATAEVTHLATKAQVHTLEKLVDFIGWETKHSQEFFYKRYKIFSLRMLTFKKAHAATMILLGIAAQADLKRNDETGVITRKQINAHIPNVKSKLHIDERI